MLKAQSTKMYESDESEEWYLSLSLSPGFTNQSYFEDIIESLVDDNGIVNDRNPSSCVCMMKVSRKNDAVSYTAPAK